MWQASSKRVEKLASENKLTLGDLKNYSDFILYVNQDNETLDVLRNELAPGRAEYFPVDFIFGIDNIVSYDNIYYTLESHVTGDRVYLADYVYFEDRLMTNSLVLNVFYTKPDVAVSAYDFFMKTYYKANETIGTTEFFDFIEYDASILKYNTLFSLDPSVVRNDFTFVPVCDEIMLRYNGNGELDYMYIYLNDVFIGVSCIRDNKVASFAEITGDLNTSFLSFLFNKDAVATAENILTAAVETAKN